MKNKIKAVFFDIDGTLVSFRTHDVPASAREAIKRLRSRGIKVFIATGRLLRHTNVVRDIEVDGYITVNGSYCLTASGDVIYEEAFPREVLHRVFELEERYGFQTEYMTHQNIYVDSITEQVQDAIEITARMRRLGNRTFMGDDPNKKEMTMAFNEHRKPVYDFGMMEIQQKKIKDYRESKELGYSKFK